MCKRYPLENEWNITHAFLQPWRAPALGVPHLWPCSWTPWLGPEDWGRRRSKRGRRLYCPTRVSPVQECGALRAAVARLWARCVHGCRSAYSRFCAMWSRLLREDSQVLGRDPSASWDARLQTRVPFLFHCPQLPRLDTAHLPRPDWLVANSTGTALYSSNTHPSFIHTQMLQHYYWKGRALSCWHVGC